MAPWKLVHSRLDGDGARALAADGTTVALADGQPPVGGSGSAVWLVRAEDLVLTERPWTVRRRDLEQALPYALEEELVDEPADYALAHAVEGGHIHVAAANRARLQAGYASLRARGIVPQAIIPDVLCLPREANSWTLLVDGERAMVRSGDYGGFACRLGNLPFLLARAVEEAEPGPEALSTTLKPSRQACETCHWPAATHSDTLLIKKRYDTDAKSTETTIRLTMHTGFDVLRESEAQGIHWHVENPVEYVATDIRNQEIPWVRVTRADGSQDTWIDPTVSAAVDPADARVMDCLDCHNTVGHPFPNPEDKVDSAIAHGLMDRRKLPSLKARSAELVEKAVALGAEGEATDDALAALVDEVAADYREDDKDPAAVAAFEETMTDILQKSTFDAPGVTWRSFPDNSAHKDFAGCFRCHDGKHLNDEGQAIPLQCNICHDIPAVKREGGPEPVTSTKISGVKQPPSHLKPNFMHEHRFQLDATCSACHGELEFGREGGSFCSNPACHGREWPEVNLNVTRDG